MEESTLLNASDVRGIELGVPRTRWNAAVNQRIGRTSLLGRVNYFGDWVDHFDARFVRGAEAPLLPGKYIVDLELAVPIAAGVSLAVGGQNVFNTFSDACRCSRARSACPTASSRRGA